MKLLFENDLKCVKNDLNCHTSSKVSILPSKYFSKSLGIDSQANLMCVSSEGERMNFRSDLAVDVAVSDGVSARDGQTGPHQEVNAGAVVRPAISLNNCSL